VTEALDSDPDIDRDNVVIFRHNLDFFFFSLLVFLFYSCFTISKKRKKLEEKHFSLWNSIDYKEFMKKTHGECAFYRSLEVNKKQSMDEPYNWQIL
jgi:hypothetical protein